MRLATTVMLRQDVYDLLKEVSAHLRIQGIASFSQTCQEPFLRRGATNTAVLEMAILLLAEQVGVRK